jgi:hypothetical protein
MRLIALWTFAALIISSSLRADVINYGDLMGSNVSFLGIAESSAAIPSLAPNLYGVPSVSNDTLIFNPLHFEASQVGPGIELLNGQLSVTVVAKPGFEITGLTISEFGDFTVATPFVGGQASAAVSVNGYASTDLGTFDNHDSVTGASAVPFGQFGVPFSMSVPITFPNTTSVTFTAHNRLTAAALTGADAAFIKKAGFRLFVTTTTAVPEPSGGFLMLASTAIAIAQRPKRIKR